MERTESEGVTRVRSGSWAAHHRRRGERPDGLDGRGGDEHGQAGTITDCTVIDQSGTYRLEGDPLFGIGGSESVDGVGVVLANLSGAELTGFTAERNRGEDVLLIGGTVTDLEPMDVDGTTVTLTDARVLAVSAVDDPQESERCYDAVSWYVNISATVENHGDTAGEYEVHLIVGERFVESRLVTVSAGERRTVTFDWTFEDSGEFRLRVNDAVAGDLTVRPVVTATPTQEPSEMATATQTPATTGTNTATATTTPTPAGRVDGTEGPTVDTTTPTGTAKPAGTESMEGTPIALARFVAATRCLPSGP
jgi:hypothetical protein